MFITAGIKFGGFFVEVLGPTCLMGENCKTTRTQKNGVNAFLKKHMF
jgi:hypothetical protein